MFKSIQSKSMFFLVAFAVCLLVITVYLIMFGIQTVTTQIKKDSIRDKAVAMANIATVCMGTGQAVSEIDEKKMNMIASNEASGTSFLINKSGKTIGSEDSENPYDLNFTGKSSVQDIYKNKIFYLSALAKVQGRNGWFVVVEEKETIALKSLNRLKTTVIVIITIMLFLLWPLGKRISFKIQKPIKELADAAAQIAGGDISHGIETSEPGELAKIADSFNLMLDNLKSTMQQVLDKSGEATSMQEIMEYVEETYDNLPGGILSINILGEITTFNHTAEELTGIDARELIGIDIKNPTPPGLKNLINPLRRCLSRGTLQLKTLADINNKNGDMIPVVYSINIQFGHNNEVLGAICVFRHIEDIRRFEESANRVKNLESLGEMAASLAHEIKNPLSSIRGYAQFLKTELEDRDTEELDIILCEVDRLTAMLDRFLNFARPKLPQLKEEDIGELIEYVVTLVKRDIPENVQIKMNLARTPKIMADKEMFEPILLNLLLNAIQAMPDGGEIRIRTSYDRKRDMVCAEIQDNGQGIPQEISEKIFEPFFTTKAEGTGMGLAIASRTIESHKGVMEVESVVGEMTKFTIMLQAVSGEEKQERGGLWE